MLKVRRKDNQRNANSGFTLVELIVVLVLMMILITLTVVGILTWQDWSQFKKENTGAETVFYAVQNQLTEWSSSKAYDEKLKKVVKQLGDDSDSGTGGFLIATPSSHDFFNGTTISYDDGDFYRWDTDSSGSGNVIWANVPASVPGTDKTKYQGKIYCIYANPGDYETYLNSQDPVNNPGVTVPAGTKLLFDMITPYISDRSVLNGAIWVEFSPEAEQVFSVSYSDRVDGFSYTGSGGMTSLLDRTENTRRNTLVGYCAAESLSLPLEGRSKTTAEGVRLENGNTLDLVIPEKEMVTADTKYTITFYPISGEELDKDDPLMMIKVTLGAGATTTTVKGASGAEKNPVTAEVTFYQGSNYYDELDGGTAEDNKKKVRLPIWVDTTKNEVHIILDAADVQAQSYLLAAAHDDNRPDESLLNTYSFYRFGLDVTELGCSVVTKTQERDSNIESPTFASVKESGAKTEYEIKNGRHLYNVRFETDYKKGVSERTFRLEDDIDWKEFTGRGTDPDNWYLSSYAVGLSDNGGKAGIHFDGYDYGINRQDSITDANKDDTSYYAFPGFRSLGINDTFTGVKEDGSGVYTISNLYIAFSANMAYGVYGKTEREKWLTNTSYDLGDFGKYVAGTAEHVDDVNWTYIDEVEVVTGREMHPCHINSNAGMYPLGLFAENSGTITDLALNAHRVIGMEEMKYIDSSGNVKDGAFVYTNMVGGFAGNNLGLMTNLTLRSVSSADEATDTITDEVYGTKDFTNGGSFINGKTDVGGILGRESWTVNSAATEITLSNLKNYGHVTGMENVGGILGRAYVIREFKATTGLNDAQKKKEEQSYGVRRQYYSDGYAIFGEYSRNGKIVVGSQKSITGTVVYPVTKITIENCISRGEIAGDDLIHDGKHIVYVYEDMLKLDKNNENNNDVTRCKDSSNKYFHCANIGGIAGITMDGIILDFHWPWGKNVQVGGLQGWYIDLADESNYSVTVKDCNAFRLYDDSALKNQNAFLNSDIRKKVEHDYYVGGVVGYARLTRFENCTSSTGTEATGTKKPFVFGRNYVGGLIGCMDQVRLVEKNNVTLQNDANVIGIMYVGGVAGGIGIGDADQELLSFRHPSANRGSGVSQCFGYLDYSYTGLKNTGLVLGIRREILDQNLISKQDADILEDYSYSADAVKEYYGVNGWTQISGIGGICGISRSGLYKPVNEQSDETMNYTLSLLGATSAYTNITYDNYKAIAPGNTIFGGNAVGGICGFSQSKYSFLNPNAEYSSRVKAVVYGQDGVGGIVGIGHSGGSWNNAYPDNAVIMGRNMVGGFAGTQINVNTAGRNKNIKLDKPFKVYGKYAVGGVVGDANGGFSIVADVDNANTSICGEAYVGGFAGVYGMPSDETLDGTVKNIQVYADYFAGGIVGAIYSAEKGNTNRVFSKIKVAGSNETINANMFAGGYTGLYGFCYGTNTSTAIMEGNKLYQLANDLSAIGNTNYAGIISKIAEHQNSANGALNMKNGDTVVALKNTTVSFTQAYMPKNQKLVQANLFAGGLFGYIPDNFGVTIDCLAEQGGADGPSTVITPVTTLKHVDQGGENVLDATTAGLSYAGGIIGRIPARLTIKRASYQGILTITEGNYLGEITEVNNGSVISSFINTIPKYTDANLYMGGLVGFNNYNGTVYNNSFTSGAILNGRLYLGGWIGYNRAPLNLTDLNVTDGSLNYMAIMGDRTNPDRTNSAIGLLIGCNGGTIWGNNITLSMTKAKNAWFMGLIAGKNTGIIGYAQNEGQANEVRFPVVVSGTLTVPPDDVTNYAGGIAGINNGTIAYATNNATISGAEFAGGIAGYSRTEGSVPQVVFSANKGSITAATGAAGMVGYANTDLLVNDCINTGTISAGTVTAGIANLSGDTPIGTFVLCRNYAAGVTYGIVSGNATSVTKCLEAGGKSGDQALAQAVSTAELDFYIAGSVSDVMTPVEDNSHWPVQLYAQQDGENYKYCYLREDFEDSGLSCSGSNGNPMDLDDAALRCSLLDNSFKTMLESGKAFVK